MADCRPSVEPLEERAVPSAGPWGVPPAAVRHAHHGHPAHHHGHVAHHAGRHPARHHPAPAPQPPAPPDVPVSAVPLEGVYWPADSTIPVGAQGLSAATQQDLAQAVADLDVLLSQVGPHAPRLVYAGPVATPAPGQITVTPAELGGPLAESFPSYGPAGPPVIVGGTTLVDETFLGAYDYTTVLTHELLLNLGLGETDGPGLPSVPEPYNDGHDVMAQVLPAGVSRLAGPGDLLALRQIPAYYP